MLWLGDGGTAIPALVIRNDIGSDELRRRARRERDGRVSARLIAIANALIISQRVELEADGVGSEGAARQAGHLIAPLPSLMYCSQVPRWL